MAVRGDPSSHTAMARTVGLPTAIAAKMVLDGKHLNILQASFGSAVEFQEGKIRTVNFGILSPK